MEIKNLCSIVIDCDDVVFMCDLNFEPDAECAYRFGQIETQCNSRKSNGECSKKSAQRAVAKRAIELLQNE